MGVLRDAFETIVLPRRVSGKFRFTSLFYTASWRPWRGAAHRLPASMREQSLSWFGPLSLLVLLAMWARAIVFVFGALHWSAGSALKMDNSAPHFLDDLYLSGTTFFTLGMGDVVPRTALEKFFTVCEAGLGFAFLAVIIGYLPVIYQAFSRREIAISLLDARAVQLRAVSIEFDGTNAAGRLAELREMYEPYVAALAEHLALPLPRWMRDAEHADNWQSAPWKRDAPDHRDRRTTPDHF